MNLKGARVILTGASGGIGSATAAALAQAEARLVLVDRQAEALQQLAQRLRAAAAEIHVFPADLTRGADRHAVPEHALRVLGGVDMLVNNAGLLHFNPFEQEDAQATERLLTVNVVAPILLARAVLPLMQQQGSGRVVNIGSIFGSIGFPFFASYSASKFALRGFSEALRRELVGSNIGVTYIAPRATRTALNRSALNRMNEALKVAMDSPERVAAAVVEAIRRDRDEIYLGWPETFFVRLNGLLPRLVDAALRRRQRAMRSYATQP